MGQLDKILQIEITGERIFFDDCHISESLKNYEFAEYLSKFKKVHFNELLF
jgi:hypothetical protein